MDHCVYEALEKNLLEAFPTHLNRMGAPDEALERIIPGLGVPGQEPELRIGCLLKDSHRWFSISPRSNGRLKKILFSCIYFRRLILKWDG